MHHVTDSHVHLFVMCDYQACHLSVVRNCQSCVTVSCIDWPSCVILNFLSPNFPFLPVSHVRLSVKCNWRSCMTVSHVWPTVMCNWQLCRLTVMLNFLSPNFPFLPVTHVRLSVVWLSVMCDCQVLTKMVSSAWPMTGISLADYTIGMNKLIHVKNLHE